MALSANAACGLLAATLALAACGAPEPAPVPVQPDPAPAVAQPPEPAPPLGLWVLAEGSQRVLDDPARIPGLIEAARRLGATDLFVQVYRGGRAWFDSSRADAGPYRRTLDASGVDTLAAVIDAAHTAGIRVHAWVNVLSLAGNRDAPIVRDLGREAVLVDRWGRSILDYPDFDVPPPDRRYYRMGTPAVYLDPAAPGVAPRLAATFAELVLRYPDLDGLHLDYIRYPDVLPFAPGSRFGVGLDFGYGPASRDRFLRETGLEAPLGESLANANRWDQWRRDRVTEVVSRVRDAVRLLDPNVVLSAAVWAYADRAYLAIGQDWRGWLEAGLLEFAVPMAYTQDDHLFGQLVDDFASSPRGSRTWVGIGAWLFRRSPERAVAQVARAEAAGAAGIALFSYDSIVAAPELDAALTAAVRDAD